MPRLSFIFMSESLLKIADVVKVFHFFKPKFFDYLPYDYKLKSFNRLLDFVQKSNSQRERVVVKDLE